MDYPIKIIIRKRLPEIFINIWFCVFARIRITVTGKCYNSYIKKMVVHFFNDTEEAVDTIWVFFSPFRNWPKIKNPKILLRM